MDGAGGGVVLLLLARLGITNVQVTSMLELMRNTARRDGKNTAKPNMGWTMAFAQSSNARAGPVHGT